MPLLTVILVLVVAGVLLWAIGAYIPMDPGILKLLRIVVIVCILLWLASLFGLFAPLSHFRVGR